MIAQIKLIEAACAALMLVGLFMIGYHFGGKHTQAKWDAVKVVQMQALAEANTKNRALEQTYAVNLQKAQNDATIRTQKLQTVAAAAARTVVSLRNQLTTTDRLLPTITAATCRDYAATADSVLAEMAEAGRGLAATADAATSDTKTLTEAWPK